MRINASDLMAGQLALNNARQARIAAYKILRAVEKGQISSELLKAMGLNLMDLKNLMTQTANQESDCQRLLSEMENARNASRIQKGIRKYNGMS